MHDRRTSKGKPLTPEERDDGCKVKRIADSPKMPHCAHERILPPGKKPMTVAERQRKRRKRVSGGFERFTILYSETVTAALYWQAIDAKMSEAAATAASTDKAKIAEGVANVIEHWAATYLSERAKRDDPEALSLYRGEMTGQPHVHADHDNIIIKAKQGTSRAYTLDRLSVTPRDRREFRTGVVSRITDPIPSLSCRPTRDALARTIAARCGCCSPSRGAISSANPPKHRPRELVR